MMATDALVLPVTPSRAVAAKALCLPVATNNGTPPIYIVGSGSEPGETYTVVCLTNGGQWACECVGGPGCSHVYAAMAHTDPAVRRALLARVRPARRMTRAAAWALLARYDGARFAVTAMPPTAPPETHDAAHARLDELTAKIVARLTGNDDGDE